MFAGLAFVLVVSVANAQPAEDKIKSLPGYSGAINYDQYSGYLNLSNGHNIHYWLTLRQGSSYPNQDPLVLWLNGGPGCSSLDGLFYEQGALLVTGDGTLETNPYAWNTLANMVFFEAPICVGFSFSDDGSCTMNDNTTADDNYEAIMTFMDKFPELSSNDFYVTGESYGGVYVPTLTRRILKGNQESHKQVQLKGFAVGNGASSGPLNQDSSMWYAYHHGIIDESMWDSLLQNCCTTPYTRQTCPFSASGDQQCKSLVTEVMEIIYGGQLNWYNIYGDCMDTVHEPRFSYQKLIHELSWLHRDFHESNDYKFIKQMQHDLDNYQGNVPCLDSNGVDIYLNRADVQKAIHVELKNVDKWSICSSTLKYTTMYPDLSDVYNDIFGMDATIYGMVYNGDTDLSCNFLLDQWFVDDLGYKVAPNGTYREWFYTAQGQDVKTSQIGGWTKDYERISVVTVRGSGHMVPQYRPIPALKMFEHFLTNTPL